MDSGNDGDESGLDAPLSSLDVYELRQRQQVGFIRVITIIVIFEFTFNMIQYVQYNVLECQLTETSI